MTHTISGTYDTLVSLGSAIYNPTTITAAARLNDGLQISYAGLTVTNSGGIAMPGTTNSGVDLLAGGSVTNQTGGAIRGYFAIYGQNDAVTVVNAGSITGYGFGDREIGGFGAIRLLAGGTVINQIDASIYGGILAENDALTVVNAGSIVVYGFSTGVDLSAGGRVTNLSSSRIEGAQAGVWGSNVATTVVNAGSIGANVGTGVRLDAGGSVTNQSGGTIYGDFTGVEGSDITVVNAGTIINGSPAIFGWGVEIVGNGSFINNQAGGSIIAYYAVKVYSGPLTVVNAGMIDGAGTGVSSAAVQFAAGYTNLLVVDPTAVFVGTVDGGNTIGATAASTLELAGTSAGTLSGIGTQFIDFAQTTVDAGAYWTLTGTNTLAAGTTLTNAGTLTALDATLSDAGLVINNGVFQIDPSTVTLNDLTGTGTVPIVGGSTLDILGTVAAGQTIVFDAGGGLLGINPTGFAGQIDGFTFGDTIDLTGVTDGVSAGIVNGNTLQIERSGNPPVDLTLDPSVNYAGNSYLVSPEGAVTEVPCFLRNTLIRTDRGEVAVQDLAVGDCVVTLSGRIRPITWIGTGQVLVSRGRRCAATPIIVRKGALADNVPYRDLRITKGHELFIGGVLIPAEFLINHRSILWDDHQQTVSVYHIELATHDVLIANGAAAESYRDDGNRWLFRNANSGWDQPPKPPCARVLTGGPIVDAIWQRLLDRAGPRPGLALTGDPDLHLLVDGARLEAATPARNVYVFRLPRAPAMARIISRAAVPQELGLARDPRCLGVALRCVVVRQMTRFRSIEAADKLLADGFHAFEADNDLRWTDGCATLPAVLFDGFDGAVELVLKLGGTMRYPAFGRPVLRDAA